MPLLKSIRIGTVTLPGNLALAPMAGVTDLPFRRICRELGADLVCTELVSARGIRFDRSLGRALSLLEIDPDREAPVAIQLFGGDPEDFRYAIDAIRSHPVLDRCDLLDLNMGCPVAKVVRNGDGAALMLDPARAEAVIRVAVEAAGRPVTVKFRLGWDAARRNAADFARMCRDAGASAITVHARTRDQMYAGKADWTLLADVVRAVDIPVFGNGDVRCGEDAVRMIRETGVCGVAVGRAAMGDPWVFRRIRVALGSEAPGAYPPDAHPPEAHSPEGHPGMASAEERAAMMRRHAAETAARLGEARGIREMRAHLGWYLRGSAGASAFRGIAVRVETLSDVEGLVADWLSVQREHGRR